MAPTAPEHARIRDPKSTHIVEHILTVHAILVVYDESNQSIELDSAFHSGGRIARLGHDRDLSDCNRSDSIPELCSPIIGAPRSEVSNAPLIRIGQRVVVSVAPFARCTCWVIC